MLLFERTYERTFKRAVQVAGITKPTTAHTMRRAFATHLLQAEYDICTVLDLLCHGDVAATMIYIHVLKTCGDEVRSPRDSMNRV